MLFSHSPLFLSFIYMPSFVNKKIGYLPAAERGDNSWMVEVIPTGGGGT
jgi:hypothetical protein